MSNKSESDRCPRSDRLQEKHSDCHLTPKSRLNYRGLLRFVDVCEFEPKPQCPSCGFDKVSIVLMPKDATHHAAIRCGQCDHFLGWQASPLNQEKRRQRQTRITELLTSPQLSQWERQFLFSVQDKRSLSPKQQEALARIEVKVGGQC